jgi:hypothetical protein
VQIPLGQYKLVMQDARLTALVTASSEAAAARGSDLADYLNILRNG